LLDHETREPRFGTSLVTHHVAQIILVRALRMAAGPAPGDLLVHELQGRADGQVCQVPASPRGGRPPRRVEELATIATSCLKR
jgi:hypothetical protein